VLAGGSARHRRATWWRSSRPQPSPSRVSIAPISEREANADDYADRLRSDPLLAQLLHRVLSGITAVRSSAEILEDVADLDDSERRRFVGAISRETAG
jgi:hypothetical protein